MENWGVCRQRSRSGAVGRTSPLHALHPDVVLVATIIGELRVCALLRYKTHTADILDEDLATTPVGISKARNGVLGGTLPLQAAASQVLASKMGVREPWCSGTSLAQMKSEMVDF